MRMKRLNGGMVVLAVAAMAMAILASAVPESAAPQAAGSSRLVSVQQLPETEICTWNDEPVLEQSAALDPSGLPAPLMQLAALQQQRAAAANSTVPTVNRVL